MGRALATWMRRRVVEQHLEGLSLAEIARTHKLSYATVRNCWHRYQRRGFDGLSPDYGNCGREGPSEQDVIYRAARYLKFLHREWGAPLIHLKLRQRYGQADLPSVRTLQRWFKKAGLTPMRKRLPAPKRHGATAPHQIWQIDAKEQITLKSGQKACYLTMVDEHSGALLEAPVFPQSRISQVALLEVRTQLIAAFKRWGLPEIIKVDNGYPFGDPQRKSIPVLALWLISLGIKVLWSRPRQPTDNAKVERMQGTSKRWADLARCQDRTQLARHLEAAALLHREQYQVSRLHYQTRRAVFPALLEIKHVYREADFDAQRAYRFLAETRLIRRVGSNGRIFLYGHSYQVGLSYKHQNVAVGFEVAQLAWIIHSQDGQEIRRLAAKRLSPSHIWSLSVSQKTESSEAT